MSVATTVHQGGSRGGKYAASVVQLATMLMQTSATVLFVSAKRDDRLNDRLRADVLVKLTALGCPQHIKRLKFKAMRKETQDDHQAGT